MKTYLTIWFNTEGSRPTVIVERLLAIGFKSMKGRYDHVYVWGRDVELDEIPRLGNAVHETLKGCKVLYKLETV